MEKIASSGAGYPAEEDERLARVLGMFVCMCKWA
jgi:hypothetical protein